MLLKDNYCNMAIQFNNIYNTNNHVNVSRLITKKVYLILTVLVEKTLRTLTILIIKNNVLSNVMITEL